MFAANQAGDDRHRQRGAAEDRHRRGLVGHQLAQPPDVQVHALRQRDDRARPTSSPTRRSVDAIGTRLDVANLDQHGPADGAGADRRPDRVQRLRPAADRPLRLRASTASRPAAASTASPRSSTRTTSSATPARSPTTSRSASTITHDLHVGYQQLRRLRGSDPQLERLGLDHRARRPPELQRHADLLHGARSSSRASGRAAPIHSEYQSQSIEINDTIRWQQLDVQRRRRS